MHLKNYSLIRDENDDIKLSPAYDLLSTKLLIPEDKEEYALTINGKKAGLKRKDFDALAGYMKINEKTLTTIYKKFGSAAEKWFSLINKSFLRQETQTDFMNLIKQRISRIELA